MKISYFCNFILLCQLRFLTVECASKIYKREALTDGSDESIDSDDLSFTTSGSINTDCQNGQMKAIKFGKVTIPEYYNKLEIPSYEISKLPSKNVTKEKLGLLHEKFPIGVGILVRGVEDLDEMKEEITVELDFMANWWDFVLYGENYETLKPNLTTAEEYNNMFTALDPIILNFIWKPDLFIEHVVSLKRPAILVKPIKVLFSNYGIVIFRARMHLRVDCDMEFRYYPADTQKCHFNIRSYSHDNSALDLVWMPTVYARLLERNDDSFDIQMLQIGNFTRNESENLLYPGYVETYDVLQFTIATRRMLGYHMIQTYIPSIFFVIITWLCFLIPASMLEVRIGVAMTTLLTLTSMFASIRENTPVVSYARAIDIWMVTCIIFVFATLCEFTIVVFMRHEEETLIHDIEEDVQERNSLLQVEANEIGAEPVTSNQQIYNISQESKSDSIFVRFRKPRSKSNKVPSEKHSQLMMKLEHRKHQSFFIEAYAFKVFFISFIIFNSIYWPWLLIQAEYFSWKINPDHNTI